MKKLFFLFAVLSFALISCEKEPFLTLSVQQITSPSSGNSTSITVNSNNPWTVSGNDWCTISPSSGQGGEVSVTVTVKENTTYDARNCTLTFTSEGLMASISVSQETNYGIVLPKNTYEVSSNAQQISVEVKANVEYDITIDADWITQSGTKALTSKSYTFNVAENTSYDGREGNITIKEKNGNNTETIQVKQAQKDAIILSTKEYNISSEAQTLEVKMQTNVDVEVIIPDNAKDWISYIETKSVVKKNVFFSIRSNSLTEYRKSDIYIKQKATNLRDTIKIIQCGKMPENEIWYTSSDESIVIPFRNDFGASIVSNIYINGKGIITFDKSITKLAKAAFKSDKLTSIRIPESIVSIGDYAFVDCYNLKSVNLPENLSNVGANPFSGCYNLSFRGKYASEDGYCFIKDGKLISFCPGLIPPSSFSVPEDVTSIGIEAFYECTSLTSITIPNTVTSIEWGAFTGCSSLVSIEIPDGVVSIEESTFRDCISLKKIKLPSGITHIGAYAFGECSALETIILPEGITTIERGVFSGCSSLKNISIPERVISIGKGAFSNCRELTKIFVPAGVTTISDSAFSGCHSLTSVEIPERVSSIGNYLLSGCRSLTSVKIPKAVKSIGNNAFSGCESLKNISIPDGVNYIGESAFYGCSLLENIVLPEGVTAIENSVFYGCASLSSVILPNTISSIGEQSFFGCYSLSNIQIPNGVSSIGRNAFRECKSLTEIVIPKGVTSIEMWTFVDCSSLKNIILPEGIITIGENAFMGCNSLAKIVIPKGVTSIEMFAFSGCVSLESVTFPNTLERIGWKAFIDCNKLNTIVVNAIIPPSIGQEAFLGVPNTCTVTIPKNTKTNYMNSWWSYYFSQILEMA